MLIIKVLLKVVKGTVAQSMKKVSVKRTYRNTFSAIFFYITHSNIRYENMSSKRIAQHEEMTLNFILVGRVWSAEDEDIW